MTMIESNRRVSLFKNQALFVPFVLLVVSVLSLSIRRVR